MTKEQASRTPNVKTGLRARKRAATRAALERIALDMALEKGYDRTTVDAICEAGMVSQRTFFNYFGSKEGAFLGPRPAPTEQAAAVFVQGRAEGDKNIVVDLAAMMTATALDHEDDQDVLAKRRQLIQATPALMDAVMIQMREDESAYVSLVLRRWARDGRIVGEADDVALSEARMVLALAMGILQFMMGEWVASGMEEPLPQVREDAIAVARRVLSKAAMERTVAR